MSEVSSNCCQAPTRKRFFGSFTKPKVKLVCTKCGHVASLGGEGWRYATPEEISQYRTARDMPAPSVTGVDRPQMDEVGQ